MHDLCCQVEKVDLRDTLDKTGEGGKREGYWSKAARHNAMSSSLLVGGIEVSVFESFVGYL